MADTVYELNAQFGSPDKPLEPDVLAELQSIMRLHSLSVQDLFYKWEAYSIKMGLDANAVALDIVRQFKQNLQDELERTTRGTTRGTHNVHVKTEKRTGAAPRAANKGSDVFGMIDGLTTPAPGRTKQIGSARKTPAVSRVKAEPASSPMKVDDALNAMGAIPPASFADRPNAGEVLEILNEHLTAAEPPIAPFPEPRIKLTAASDQKKLGYRPMAMKLSEASEILDDRIEEFITLVREHHNIDDWAFGNPAAQSTSEIVAVGRIACDSLEGKLNPSSVVLETSRRTGAGLRVPLGLSRLKSYQLFPGQIIACRGINSSGKEFTAHEILSLPLLPNAASSPDVLQSHISRLRGRDPDAMDTDDASPAPPLNIMIASGPYTADDNLLFEPLATLCAEAADSYTDLLLLTGPFLDAEHPLLSTGDFDLPAEANIDPDKATMSTVFRCLISPHFHRLASANPSVTVLLVPSVRDLLAKHVSWPQEAFSRKELGLPKCVKIVGNPSTVNVNEMVLGVSSQDILWELRHEELVSAGVGTGDSLSRACRYLIEQRHFFPLFPPTDRRKLPKTGGGIPGTEGAGIPPGAMLDISYLKLGEFLHVRPDVLVVPSALSPFAKVRP